MVSFSFTILLGFLPEFLVFSLDVKRSHKNWFLLGDEFSMQSRKLLDTINISVTIKNGFMLLLLKCNLNSILLSERISHRVD